MTGTANGAPAAGGPRTSFACLWCGRSWTVRGPDDLEGFAQLCPDCLGKAGENPFLRFRLRAALDARAAATKPTPPSGPSTDGGLTADDESRAAASDDWYLRRGPFARGPIHDTAWNAELDAAGTWLDGLPLAGRIVELAAGTGWWSPLLVGKGELWLSDTSPAALERARERLLAHGLRAHLHVRDAWAEPEGDPAGALFAGFWLSMVERPRTAEFLELARRWLAPGGRLVLIDALPDPQSDAVDEPVKVDRTPDEIGAALRAAGFDDVSVTTTGRYFVLATGVRG